MSAQWKRARKAKIGPRESDLIIEKLRLFGTGDEAVARIAEAHDLSSMTIRKIAGVRGVAS